jgi:hypothetical protein
VVFLVWSRREGVTVLLLVCHKGVSWLFPFQGGGDAHCGLKKPILPIITITLFPSFTVPFHSNSIRLFLLEAHTAGSDVPHTRRYK